MYPCNMSFCSSQKYIPKRDTYTADDQPSCSKLMWGVIDQSSKLRTSAESISRNDVKTTIGAAHGRTVWALWRTSAQFSRYFMIICDYFSHIGADSAASKSTSPWAVPTVIRWSATPAELFSTNLRVHKRLSKQRSRLKSISIAHIECEEQWLYIKFGSCIYRHSNLLSWHRTVLCAVPWFLLWHSENERNKFMLSLEILDGFISHDHYCMIEWYSLSPDHSYFR